MFMLFSTTNSNVYNQPFEGEYALVRDALKHITADYLCFNIEFYPHNFPYQYGVSLT